MAADLLLRNGSIYSAGMGKPRRGDVEITGGRIADVSFNGGLAPGPDTRVVDIDGRTVVAGFQDAHVHPPEGGLVRFQCNLHETTGRENYERIIREYVGSRPEAPWILGGGWYQPDFERGCPHRSILDALVPDRPAFLPNRDGHGAWVNSKALELAGITAATPDPPDGRIERDPDGSPQGTLHEGAQSLVERLVPPTSDAEWDEGILEAQRYLHSLGITAWQDAIVTEETLASYRRLAERGALTAKVVAALWWDRHRGEEQVEELLRLREAGAVGNLRADSVKIMQDGIPENFTAAMIDPYLDGGGPPKGRGLSFVDPEALKGYVTRLDREGFQVHVHAIGDRAVREALDAFEAANITVDRRHHIAHIEVVHPEDIERFAALQVVPNAQPYWACFDPQMRDLVEPYLGPERTGWQYPFASLLASGARMAMGSDWPVSTPNPMEEIQVALTRQYPDEEVFFPEQRIGLADALDAFTLGSAFVNHLDDRTGTIQSGKLADLAVMDRDLFDTDPTELDQAQVLLTLVEGQPVHAAPELGW